MDIFGVASGYMHRPTLYHNLVAKDLVTWTPSGIYLAHYVNDILLTSDSLAELEAAAVSLQLALSQWG
jgi:hypothetical protein